MAYWASNLITGKTTAAALTTPPSFPWPPVTVASAGTVVQVRASIGFASGTNPAANDVIEMAIVPAGCLVVDWTVYNDDFGDASLETKMGFMSGSPGDITRAITTVGEEIWAATGDTLEAAAVSTMYGSAAMAKAWQQLTPSTANRSIGVGWVAAAGTATSGSIRYLILDLSYRYAPYGV